MASKLGSKPSSWRLFPRRGNISSLQNYFIVKVLLKTMWRETEGLVLLSWRVLFVSGRVVRWEGGRVVRWQGGRIVRWQDGKGERMVGQKGWRYLV